MSITYESNQDILCLVTLKKDKNFQKSKINFLQMPQYLQIMSWKYLVFANKLGILAILLTLKFFGPKTTSKLTVIETCCHLKIETTKAIFNYMIL